MTEVLSSHSPKSSNLSMSPPCQHRRLNDFKERKVQTARNAMMKGKDSKTDMNMALLCLRTRPIDNNLPYPVELWYSKAIRRNIQVRIRNIQLEKDRISERLLTNKYRKVTTRSHVIYQRSKMARIKSCKVNKQVQGTIIRRITSEKCFRHVRKRKGR